MKIALRHSGFLTRVLRSRHRWPIRLVTGVACAGFAALTTASPVLAAEAFRRIWNDNDFMLGLRRMSWYARRSWLGLDMSQDPLFVFCDDLDLPALHSMARFLERRQLATPQDLWLGDMAYVTAALAQAQAEQPAFPQRCAALRRLAMHCLRRWPKIRPLQAGGLAPCSVIRSVRQRQGARCTTCRTCCAPAG